MAKTFDITKRKTLRAYERAEKSKTVPSDGARQWRPPVRRKFGVLVDLVQGNYEGIDFGELYGITQTSGKLQKIPLLDVIEMLDFCNGLLAIASRLLGVTYKSIIAAVNASTTEGQILRDALDMIKASLLDEGELMLLQKIREGETRAIIYYLDSQGKERGYGEQASDAMIKTRVEITGDFPEDSYS